MSKAAELAALIGSQTALSNRNLIKNGAMNIAQRSTSVTDIGASTGYFVCDRWRVNPANTAGRFTMSQVAITDLPGFANALKIDVTTADTSIASNETMRLEQRLEGQDLQQIAKGTSSAKPLTLSFYVKGNAAATYVVELRDPTNSRNNTQAFSVTTSFTRVSLSFAADTSGALTDDSTRQLDVRFILHGGSDFTSGTFASNTWASVDNTNSYAGSKTSIFDSTDRELFITGVQLEVGDVATPFEHRSFGDELRQCKRYFERFAKALTVLGQASEANCGLWSGLSRSGNSGNNQGVMTYQTKRTNPTISVSSAAHINGIFPISPFSSSLSSFGIDGNAGIDNCFVNAANNASSAPSSDCASSAVMGNSSGTLDIDAEL